MFNVSDRLNATLGSRDTIPTSTCCVLIDSVAPSRSGLGRSLVLGPLQASSPRGGRERGEGYRNHEHEPGVATSKKVRSQHGSDPGSPCLPTIIMTSSAYNSNARRAWRGGWRPLKRAMRTRAGAMASSTSPNLLLAVPRVEGRGEQCHVHDPKIVDFPLWTWFPTERTCWSRTAPQNNAPRRKSKDGNTRQSLSDRRRMSAPGRLGSKPIPSAMLRKGKRLGAAPARRTGRPSHFNLRSVALSR
ncbi:hypothetical protein BDY21DRAFT_174135 [Lineolata rhizophorae]|uniref:Uncharacterized protein n=1 Tax=Lineolata rhizophorae TaxID=578093 RepID=A0A6A6NKW3_9PEZI|nr:hypothetical protein BDY21DRAFT_174135 [Lineolata rhizophorae]